MDTNARSSERPWALWAALTLLAAGLIAVLYVLSPFTSKAEAVGTDLTRFARGSMDDLAVMANPPAMPTRVLHDANGAETSLPAMAGQVMVMNLWATWCAPCVEEMPTLAALQRRYQGRIRVVTVSIDGATLSERAEQRLSQLTNNGLPFYIEPTRRLMFDIAAPGMPTTVVYDPRGHEVARIAGGANWNSPEAIALIDAVLADNPAPRR